MNVLFLTLLDFNSIDEHNIYTDLLRKFYQEGHSVYVVSPVERKNNQKTHYIKCDNHVGILKLKIGNIQKTNIIEKGISTVTLEQKFIQGIKKYYSDIKFDLILYSTPPITLQKAVKYVKTRDNATTYLMLKDIFPQNAVDMGMLSKHGLKGILYKYFRLKEKALYRDSDYIGCMSRANVDYVLKHNPEVERNKVEICPNCIEVSSQVKKLDSKEIAKLKKKYGIPQGKKIFVYGGNLGRPQGIGFIIECIKRIEHEKGIYIIIIGSGTEYARLEEAIQKKSLKNTKLYAALPKEEYDAFLQLCDVGLIFLDYRFTIPNFPSRLLAYMDKQLPVMAIVDDATDVGKVIEDGEFGWSCRSKNIEDVIETFVKIANEKELSIYGQRALLFLQDNYSVGVAYAAIMRHF